MESIEQSIRVGFRYVLTREQLAQFRAGRADLKASDCDRPVPHCSQFQSAADSREQTSGRRHAAYNPIAGHLVTSLVADSALRLADAEDCHVPIFPALQPWYPDLTFADAGLWPVPSDSGQSNRNAADPSATFARSG